MQIFENKTISGLQDFQYSGGQYCFICIPALSVLEWHPFSLSSHPSQDSVFLHVRALGDWTKSLHALASKVIIIVMRAGINCMQRGPRSRAYLNLMDGCDGILLHRHPYYQKI